MTSIIRTPTRATGGLTDEERARLADHTQRWIRRALRTDPIEPDKIVPAIEALYAAAGLATPRVVLVPSPLVMAYAYGAASALLSGDANRNEIGFRLRSPGTIDINDAEYYWRYPKAYAATKVAVAAAAHGATRRPNPTVEEDPRQAANTPEAREERRALREAEVESHKATSARTNGATLETSYGEVRAATDQATYDDIAAATRQAVYDAVYTATYEATFTGVVCATEDAEGYGTTAVLACQELAGNAGLRDAANAPFAIQGGNMTAGWECLLAICRDVLGLSLPAQDKFAVWEACAIHGGFRVMHPEFCIVSDFPEFIRVDENNKPHCADGPSHRWRDGWSLYHWRGTNVPSEWIEDRASLTPDIARNWPEYELRRAAYDMLGMEMAEDDAYRPVGREYYVKVVRP